MKARKRKKESNKSSIDDEKEIKEDTFDFSEDTETHDNASYKDFKGNDHSDTEESQSNLNENLIQDDDPLMAASFAAPKSDLKIADTPTTTKLRNDRKVCSCHWKFWANIEKSKLDIEQKKLEFDQKKFEWQLEKEEAELELKEKELKQQFELRKLELEKEERLEKEKIKLQLEQEERLKKYEIEINWMSMKRKLENLHIDYLKAKVWSRESNVNQDQQVVAGEQSIATSASEQEYRSVNFWVNDGFDTSVGESGLQQCVSEPALTEAPEITYMDIEKLEDEDVGCSHFASNTTLGFVERPQPFPAYPEELIVSTQDIQPPKLQSHGIGTNTCVSCLAFERRKLEVEHQKLQLEQKKFEWQQEKEGAELELKKRELENQFELKSLELAKEERMEKTKLQLEHKERIKKYEMKMKLDHFKRSSGLYNPHN
uniref:Uncharacterized protein n=1 Tax=Glossina morsitans morsitans TaxID=37546 RepID=A0A1B0G6E3_GLOMM